MSPELAVERSAQVIRGLVMTIMHRRHFLGAATLLLAAGGPFVPADVALAQQMSAKPEVKLSEATPAVVDYVDKMSRVVKEDFGVELSTEQKAEMVNHILSRMKDQDTYAFVDP